MAKLQSGEKGSDEDIYDYVDIINEFSGFFFAGTDTTSHLTTLMLFYMERNSEVKRRVMEEVHSVVHSNKDITNDNLQKLKYLEAVRNETQRIYGPGTGILPRRATVEHLLGKVLIPKDTLIGLDLAPNNYNPVYYKNPDEFNPDRWLNDELTKVHPYLFIPFSSGQRNCIGQHLARLEAKIMASKFLNRYDYIWENAETMRLKRKFLVAPESTQIKVTVRKDID